MTRTVRSEGTATAHEPESAANESPVGEGEATPVVARLSMIDRFLPVWIATAMVGGIVLGRLVPGLDDALDAVKVGGTSLPIALGLLLMMYPVLARVRYREIGLVTADKIGRASCRERV